MNNNECNVARDLMPLVIDQVASEESRMLVETHVSGCEPCAQVYTDMQAQTPEKDDTAEDNSFSAAMRQLRRTVGWRRMKVIILSVVITLGVLAAGSWGYRYFVEESNRSTPLDWYNATVSRAKDGTGLITINCSKGYYNGYGSSSDPDTGIITLGTYSPYILTSPYNPATSKSRTDQLYIRWKDGIGFIFEKETWQTDAIDSVVKQIRVGTEDQYRIIYQLGDAVPLCSEEMDKVVQLQKKYDDANKAADNALQELADYEDSIAPEKK